MQTPIILAIIALLAIGGIYVASTNDTQESVTQNTQEPSSEKKMTDDTSDDAYGDEMVKEDVSDDTQKDEMMKGDETMQKDEMKKEMANDETNPPVVVEDPASPGAYLPYDASKLAMANTGDVVLFFHASWCPGCRALDSDITGQHSAIPGDLTILKLDYDTETELKKKYGVTTQHTLVQVDAGGNLVKKWSGSSKLSQIVETRI